MPLIKNFTDNLAFNYKYAKLEIFMYYKIFAVNRSSKQKVTYCKYFLACGSISLIFVINQESLVYWVLITIIIFLQLGMGMAPAHLVR